MGIFDVLGGLKIFYPQITQIYADLFRHSREGGNPSIRRHSGRKWIPAFAGMTIRREQDRSPISICVNLCNLRIKPLISVPKRFAGGEHGLDPVDRTILLAQGDEGLALQFGDVVFDIMELFAEYGVGCIVPVLERAEATLQRRDNQMSLVYFKLRVARTDWEQARDV